MKLVRFKFLIDTDVISPPHAQLEFYITAYLNDPQGWSKHGYFFEPVTTNEDVLIRLSLPKTIEKQCGDGKLSCAELGGKRVWLNSQRWFHGGPRSKLSLDNYRQYMVSHEIGHILGFDHEKCPCKKCPAPIMMQQTLGIGECSTNTKVLT
jgi:hypothetical protein